MKTIEVHTKEKTYPIYYGHGILKNASELIGRKNVFLVSDDGVPEKWRKMLQDQFPQAQMYVFPNGEAHKNVETLLGILASMQKVHLSRKDTVIALGGGVVGDMAGFAAAIYMRGIPYINIPTTTISEIDSSIGGKTAVDFNGVKNNIGAFHQPDMVLIDPDVLTTLPKRHLHNGLAEAVKAGLIRDPALFAIFEKENWKDHLDEIILRSLEMKRQIVENDEKETGERKLLNFGHTFGHGFEAYFDLDTYLHGECVAMGMMKILNNEEIKDRLRKVLNHLSLPTECDYDPEAVYQLMLNDKKAAHDHITMVQVDEIGKAYLTDWSLEDVRKRLGL